MNPENSSLGNHEPESFCDDVVDLVFDGPGDTTVRPCPPHLLPMMMAEREKLQRGLAWRKQQRERSKEDERPNASQDPA